MLCEPGGEPVGVHPGEQLLVEAVDVADGLLQDLGLKRSSQWRLDELNPFGGVTDPDRVGVSDSQWQSALLFHGGGGSNPLQFSEPRAGPLSVPAASSVPTRYRPTVLPAVVPRGK